MRTLFFMLLACSLLGACEQTPAPADIVLHNGGIYTVDEQRDWVEALAVRDKLIVATGSNESVQDLIGPDTVVIDLSGRMAMPGIIDSHTHPLEGGYEKVFCDLFSAETPSEVVSVLKVCADDSDPDDQWFQAVGLSLGMFGVSGADNSLLDGIAPGKFIFVDMSDGHAALVNDKVLDLVGFGADTPDPEGGVIERREGSREPNGTIRETARHAVDLLRPPRTHDTNLSAMRSALARMNSHGITGAWDVWVGEQEMLTYKTLDEAGELSLYVLGGIIDEGVFEKHTGEDLQRVITERQRFESSRISHNSVKIMVDGVFEGETGAVLDPYLTTGSLGVLNHSQAELRQRVQMYYDQGMQIHFHTMGDRATRAAFDALAWARENGSEKHLANRHGLSHLGLIDPMEYDRFAEQNAAAVFTAVWASPDEWTINLEIPTLGQERVDGLYPLRSVNEAGGVIAGSSDWNYGDLNPLLSIETAITRQDPWGESELQASTQEAVDLPTMIDAYTINGAWLLQREDVTGSLEAGKLADIVIYDTNLFEIEPEAISDVQVDLTIYNGSVVYDRFVRQ